jgi:hypothetical protein
MYFSMKIYPMIEYNIFYIHIFSIFFETSKFEIFKALKLKPKSGSLKPKLYFEFPHISVYFGNYMIFTVQKPRVLDIDVSRRNLLCRYIHI